MSTRFSPETSIIEIPSERRGLKLIRAVKKDMLGYFVRLMRQEGPYAWLSLGGRTVLMLNDAKGIEHVLSKNASNYKKSYFYKVLRPLLGKSLLMTEGDLWKKQRRESSPPFSAKYFEEMSQQMVTCTERMFARWEPGIASNKSVDLNFETMWYTLDILLQTLFHEEKDGIARNMQIAITNLLREAEERVWAPISLPQWLMMKIPKYRKSLKFLNDTICDFVEIRRTNKAHPEDLLSALIGGYKQTAEEQIALRDQVMTFLLAGHETTANALLWSLYYLSQRPEIWLKIQAEVDLVLGSRTPTMQDLKELKYTRQVFDEVLRFHPIVWTMSRDNLTDDKIPLESGEEISIPKGTCIMMCTYAVHRRERYWKNPEAFDPGRFAADVSRERPTFAYFPFGGGPRHCLGLRFALVESVIALAMLAQRYNVELVSGQNIVALPNITLRPNGEVLFKIVRRTDVKVSAPEAAKVEEPAESAPAKCPFHRAA